MRVEVDTGEYDRLTDDVEAVHVFKGPDERIRIREFKDGWQIARREPEKVLLRYHVDVWLLKVWVLFHCVVRKVTGT